MLVDRSRRSIYCIRQAGCEPGSRRLQFQSFGADDDSAEMSRLNSRLRLQPPSLCAWYCNPILQSYRTIIEIIDRTDVAIDTSSAQQSRSLRPPLRLAAQEHSAAQTEPSSMMRQHIERLDVVSEQLLRTRQQPVRRFASPIESRASASDCSQDIVMLV